MKISNQGNPQKKCIQEKIQRFSAYPSLRPSRPSRGRARPDRGRGEDGEGDGGYIHKLNEEKIEYMKKRKGKRSNARAKMVDKMYLNPFSLYHQKEGESM